MNPVHHQYQYITVAVAVAAALDRLLVAAVLAALATVLVAILVEQEVLARQQQVALVALEVLVLVQAMLVGLEET